MKMIGQSLVFVLIVVVIGSLSAYHLMIKVYATYAEVEELISE